ncbi:MAG TPA: hypothetical protein VGH33_18525 [Isosphaeraceae bacterium]|jgi:broad specificity phosphatase PhoE
MSEELPEVSLARHGETAWTVANRHTGRFSSDRTIADYAADIRGAAPCPVD